MYSARLGRSALTPEGFESRQVYTYGLVLAAEKSPPHIGRA